MNSIYNFEFPVKLLSYYPSAELHIFYYGKHVDFEYLESLRSLNSRVIFHSNESRSSFIEFLRQSHLFVRSNTVDSFGVSVFDAILWYSMCS